MAKKQHNRNNQERKIDLRNVMLSEEIDTRLDEYILKQKKQKRIVLRGEAGAELIDKGLQAEGIE